MLCFVGRWLTIWEFCGRLPQYCVYIFEELELRVPEKWKEEMLHVYVAVSDQREKEIQSII